MSDRDPTGFKIRLDDEELPNSVLIRHKEVLGIDTLNRRMTRIFVLFLILMAMVFYLAYSDITQRVLKVHTLGTEEVQGISRDLESRFSTLSVQFAKLEDSTGNRLGALEKTAQGLRKDLDQNTAQLTASVAKKADQGQLEKTASDMQKALAPLKKGVQEMAAMKQDIEALGALKKEVAAIGGMKGNIESLTASLHKIRGEFADLQRSMNTFQETVRKDTSAIAVGLGSLRKESENQKKQLSELSKKGTSPESLEAELKKQDIAAKQRLAQTSADMQARIDKLDTKIRTLARSVDILKSRSVAPPGLKLPPAGLPATGSAASPREGITEKNLE
jgi:chromosome segregation ATPase